MPKALEAMVIFKIPRLWKRPDDNAEGKLSLLTKLFIILITFCEKIQAGNLYLFGMIIRNPFIIRWFKIVI